jgi:uncharacterized protein YwqG
MLPEFLEAFREPLEKYKLDCIAIDAIPLEEDEYTDIRESKFMGLPYLPIGVDYPKAPDGKPMLMLAQINCTELGVFGDYPTKGILQFYVSPDWMEYYDAEFDHMRVLYHEDTTAQAQEDFSFLTEELMMGSPIAGEHSLQFFRKTEPGGFEDFRFDFEFNGEPWFDYAEKLNENQEEAFNIYFDTSGNKIGGYAYFTQEDPRDGDKDRRDDMLLLQIDSGDGIMIGDVGVLHFFINKDDLKNRNFRKVYFQWDCC